ncbi:MAG TPA: thioesterase, partial [Verrucomicrobiota bacterium]|nr:thioesterase [Verrucomicrobiota bacterium]
MTTPASSTPVWTQRLRVCSYDVDSTRRATSVSVCRYFLDAAWNHAETLGVGFARLAAQGRFWVLSRLRIEFARCPAWGEAFALRTWPRGVKSVFALRDFEMTDDAGSRLAAGTSAWLVVDLVTKRPQRLDRLMPGLSEMNGPSALGRDPEKLPDGEPGDEAFSAPVRYTDLDVNRHVGSSGYVA